MHAITSPKQSNHGPPLAVQKNPVFKGKLYQLASAVGKDLFCEQTIAISKIALPWHFIVTLI
jgi:hypothetical protein